MRAALKGSGDRIRPKSMLTRDGPDSRVCVIHGCFSEGGNSIQVSYLEALVSEAARQLRSFSG